MKKGTKGKDGLREEMANALEAYNVGKPKRKQIEMYEYAIASGQCLVFVRFKREALTHTPKDKKEKQTKKDEGQRDLKSLSEV